MSSPERKVIQVTKFLAQETGDIRGKLTCYPTSIVNAAIALEVVTTEEARIAHTEIINQLITIPDLWNGPVQIIRAQDTRIADIIENYLPIRLGVDDSEIGRLMNVPRTYTQIYQNLLERRQAHVIIVPDRAHAYAVIGARQEGLAYIDPFDPYTIHVGSEEWFKKNFQPDNDGCFGTTPVRQRVRVLGVYET
ncbi:hypothetical protein HYT18_02040 [Candidatus Microgenomates bacterium]|nr:hypothetical protein [Candidatus Microgenomates bacterium]